MSKKKSQPGAESKKYSYISRSFSYDHVRYYVKGKSEAECLEKKFEKLAELKRGNSGISSSITVSTWASKWLETYIRPKIRRPGAEKIRGTMSQKSYSMYERFTRNYILHSIGRLKMCDVKDIHLQRILNSCAGMSFSQVTKLRIVIKGMFSQAFTSRVIFFDPSLKLTLPASEKGHRRSLSFFERQAFDAAARESPHGLYFRFLLATGIRPNESAALKVMALDLQDEDSATVTITSAVESGTRTISSPKTEAGVRLLPIPSDLVSDLRSLISSKSPLSFVFTRADGESMLSEDSIRCWWKSFSRLMDLKMGAETTARGHIYDPKDLDADGRPLYPDETGRPRDGHKIAQDLVIYCLRHTYCTDLKRAGVPLKTAQYLMGHANITTTANVYTHSDEDDVKNAAQLINAYRQNPPNTPTVENIVENLN